MPQVIFLFNELPLFQATGRHSVGTPSECISYTPLSDADRHVNHGNTNDLCDRHIQTGWYRFTGAAGTRMPRTCPAMNRCNTDASGWLRDPHPTVSQGIVERTVCYHWLSQCCHWSNTIQVLNCGDFYIYKLVPPNYCQLRYCGTGEITSKFACYHLCQIGGCQRFVFVERNSLYPSTLVWRF